MKLRVESEPPKEVFFGLMEDVGTIVLYQNRGGEKHKILQLGIVEGKIALTRYYLSDDALYHTTKQGYLATTSDLACDRT